ncbi:MAG: alpha/beta hydrolase [Pseudomonadota bacterium]
MAVSVSTHLIEASFGRLTGYLHRPGGVSCEKRPVVVWPSLFSTAAVQQDLVTRLSRDRTVLAIDPPGHGESLLKVGGPGLDMASVSSASLELMDISGLKSALWVGTSWGGLIGIEIALRMPQRIAHLSCLNTPFAFHPNRLDRSWWLPTMARIMGRRGVFARGVAQDFFLPATRNDTAKTDAMRAHADTFSRGSNRGLAAAAGLIFRDRTDIWAKLPDVPVPTLVIAGRHDPLYDLDEQQQAADRIPRSRFVVLDVAHIAAVDAPAEVELELRHCWTEEAESAVQQAAA